MFGDLGRLVSFENNIKACRGVLFLVKLQVLHNTSPEVFLNLLNEVYCPKSEEKIPCVKRKLHALCISSITIPEPKIHGVKYTSIWVFSDPYFPVYGKIREREREREIERERTRIAAYVTPWLAS